MDPYLNVSFRVQEFAPFFYSRLLMAKKGPGIPSHRHPGRDLLSRVIWGSRVSVTLTFLGYGVPPPFPTWGAAQRFGFNMLGDALRDTLDPRLRGR